MNHLGILYGLGIGPGDPDLITVKAARILGGCSYVFVPRLSGEETGLAQRIAQRHINPSATLVSLDFSLDNNRRNAEARWEDQSEKIASVLKQGIDAAYVTLGDTFFYSTFSYMLKGLKKKLPDVKVISIPGISAFSAAASTALATLGEGNTTIRFVCGSIDTQELRDTLLSKDNVVIMKIGNHLNKIISVLREVDFRGNSVMVSRVGLPGQRIITDIWNLNPQVENEGYMSVILLSWRKD
jgi:precorrin-2/cobalt-factor-2 C20-methyltransferase